MHAYILIPIVEFIFFTAAQFALIGYWRNKLPDVVKNIHYGINGQDTSQMRRKSTTFSIALSLSIGVSVVNFVVSFLAREIISDFALGFFVQILLLGVYAYIYKVNKIDKQNETLQ